MRVGHCRKTLAWPGAWCPSSQVSPAHFSPQATPNSDGKIEPISTFAAHGDVVEDVAWSRHHQHLFGSVSDDKHLYLWDIRAGDKPTQAVQAHEAELNSLSFNPFQEHLLLTASSDKVRGQANR